MLRAGMAGFVLKGVPPEDLQRAVRVVADGGAWLDPAVTARVLAIYRSAAPPAARTGPESGRAGLDALTSREREVLVLIGHGRTNGEIACELFVSEGTIKTHINHLFTKLRLRDRAAAVVFAFDHDLVTRELAEPCQPARDEYGCGRAASREAEERAEIPSARETRQVKAGEAGLESATTETTDVPGRLVNLSPSSSSGASHHSRVSQDRLPELA